ncbi:Bug family tripartite tricarboxylate transporter substrate binding protein [Pseudorhodoferax sp.]|uniref:Bug family tripartite tricarboxylate transporter substrate binding protein n=1 Tax=Pseudorhodoferax sp. TaxID=1993553 RepID=UPI0039E3E4FF
MKSHLRRALAILPFVLSLPASAADTDFPSKPLRLLVGYAPASGADVVARVLAHGLEDTFKQGVIVENKSGAGGALAAQETARAAPDGYTLMVAAMPQMTILPAIGKVPYDVERDFVPVSHVVDTDLVLVTNPERVPSGSMQEFAAWARKQPSLFFGTPGPGTVGHFGAFFFADAVGAKVEPIHFRNTGEQVTALLNGDIHAEYFSYAAALPLVKAGKLKALLTTSPTRSAMFPDVPTSAEAGYPGMQFASWYGVFAPAGTPAAVVDRLSAEIIKASKSPAIRTRLEDAGLRVTATGRAEFSRVLRADIEHWGKAVRATELGPQK